MCTTMDPPIETVHLPADVARDIREAQTSAITGSITLHFLNGEIGAVDLKRQRQTRKKLTRESPRS
jgi:hypothetical protein